MTLLDRWERRLQSWIEGLVGRAVPGRVHPVEIARHIARAMDQNRTVSVLRVYAPNAFEVVLHPQDLADLESLEQALGEEMALFVQEQAGRKRYTLVGPAQVRFVGESDVPPGQVRIRTRFVPQEPPKERAVEPEEESTRLYPSPPSGGVLVVTEGVQAGMRFGLREASAVVGRQDSCDIVIPDPAVSRRHFRIERAEEGFRIVDLGSTNGTFVNDRRVTAHRLRPGDRIRIGGTVLEYREEDA